MTNEGKRLARVSVVSDHSNPRNFVEAWYCFRQFYLATNAVRFYREKTGGLVTTKFYPSPRFHYQMVEDLSSFDYNAEAAPRGGAKSVIVGVEIPLMLLCTVPYVEVALCLAVDRMLPKRFGKIKDELVHNEHLIADFGPLRPAARGDGAWSSHLLKLRNGAMLEGFSTEGRKRGARPDLFILDDPEFDKEKPESSRQLQEKFGGMLFRQIMPMLQEGAKLFWIGTIIDRRSNLYLATQRKNPRFKNWNIRIYRACEIDDSGEFSSLIWPEMWSRKFLKRRQKEIGEAVFAAEYLNEPTSEQARLLEYTPHKNTYTATADPTAIDRPLSAPAHYKIHYHILNESTGEYEPASENFLEWVHGLFRMTMIDFGREVNYTADFSCVATMGLCRRDILWLLDIWLGRVTPDVLHHEILRQGLKWRSHIVSPEAVSVQYRLMEDAREFLLKAAPAANWVPVVIPPEYPRNTEKAVRIATSLEWRFPIGRIKYPVSDNPHVVEAINQTKDFTMDLSLLPFDDAIDTIAMSGYTRRQSGVPKTTEPVKMSFEERLGRGETVIPGTNMPLIGAVDINKLKQETLDGMRENYYRRRSCNIRRNHRRPRL